MSVQRPATVGELDTPGARIRFLRQAIGMTQKGLGAKVFATQAAVSQWETDRWLPSRATQLLIADALNTTRAFLFGDSNEKAS